MKQMIAACFGVVASLLASAAMAASVEISTHDIGGQVSGANGPEAGV